MRLPLLAIISGSLLSTLESLLIRGTEISVRSMAMSPELLVVVICDCGEGSRKLGGGRKREVKEGLWVFHFNDCEK